MHTFKRFIEDQSASIAIIIAASIVPLLIAMGVAFETGRAIWLKQEIDEVADATALYAVSRPMLVKPEAFAKDHASKFFMDRLEQTQSGSSIKLTSLNVGLKSYANGQRRAEISYSYDVKLLLGGLLNKRTLNFHGTNSAVNALSPNIDFHILLDTSPSMAFPTTREGMEQLAKTNGSGCRFACHSSNGKKGKRRDGSRGDLYSVARSYDIPLRLDAEAAAVVNIAAYARDAARVNDATYRLSVSEFNIAENFRHLVSLTSSFDEAASAVKHLDPPLYYKDKCVTAECLSTDPGDGNRASASSDALDKMNAFMDDPGAGFDDQKPQEVLLMITDGMRDEVRPDPTRPDFEIDTQKCQAIKDRGIRIGVLYTEYSPESCEGDDYTTRTVAPYLDRLEPALRECASEESLFIKVKTGNDISEALQYLFSVATRSARITH